MTMQNQYNKGVWMRQVWQNAMVNACNREILTGIPSGAVGETVESEKFLSRTVVEERLAHEKTAAQKKTPCWKQGACLDDALTANRRRGHPV
ncbi:hypothetical protein, partial [Burkholderia contaminans]|uniref:hypothetical protein n=1 Tax=Burkholderia contaminans TaxID=488447 RepID=UPI002D7F69D2